ncbi:hypothetical protein M885DRAFT_572215 [Pelagophyceae sp. CCMP2097]|nr:hypothetical protein M885DRAFT_572215 [Pelagophyceae sp. CCMP2097]
MQTLALQRAIFIHFADRKGVFVFHAPFEADAVLVGLAQDRVVDAVVTEDSDLALYQRVSVIANSFDCGVFASYFAHYISLGVRPTFSQEHMPHLRRRLMTDIL